MTERAAPLAGIRVLDLTRVLAGPHCGRMLHDLGAEVIKVEPPDGDLTRFTSPKVGSMATYFMQQNAGKKCVSIDLSTVEGADLFRRLVAISDVVIENYRAGVMNRLGLGWSALRTSMASGVPVVFPSKTPDKNSTRSSSLRGVTMSLCPGLRRSSSA